MPTYQYRCSECSHFFEQVQSFSDDALTECPECRGLLRKVFNAVGVVFKGSGFYKTDSRGSSASSASAGSSTATASADAGPSSSSNGSSGDGGAAKSTAGSSSSGSATPSTSTAAASS